MTKVITQSDLDLSDIVQMTAYAIARGEESRGSVPNLITKIINNKAWTNRNAVDKREKDGQTIWVDRESKWREDEFALFIKAPFPNGLSSSVDIIKALISNDENALKLFEKTVKQYIPARHENGTNQHNTEAGGNILPPKMKGEAEDYIISVLKRDAPDLAELVINDEITAQEGKRQLMLRQGKRPKYSISLNINNLEAFASNLKSKLTPDEIAHLVNLLQS